MDTDADDASSQRLNRRDFVVMAGVAGIAAGTASPAMAQSETDRHLVAQPTASPASDGNTSDILVEALIGWGATHVFGIVGDGINPIIEALRKRQDRIAFVSVRHEEAAAFMATAFAKHTGRLGACLATTGPGAVHLTNGRTGHPGRHQAGACRPQIPGRGRAHGRREGDADRAAATAGAQIRSGGPDRGAGSDARLERAARPGGGNPGKRRAAPADRRPRSASWRRRPRNSCAPAFGGSGVPRIITSNHRPSYLRGLLL